MGNTYGTWLRGDPRGWRERHHRLHVVGDYEHPPQLGTYEKLLDRSQRLMRRQRVILDPPARRVTCHAIAAALRYHAVELVDLCVGPKHYHILARFEPLPGRPAPQRVLLPGVRPDKPIARNRSPRHLVGIAKKESARELSRRGLAPQGGVWSVRCRVRPIRSRAHQLRVARYIRRHVKQGAVVWSLLSAHDASPRNTP